MNKLLVVLGVAGVGYAFWRRQQAEQAEQDLWAEATDTVR